jgi:transcriptional regulator with PAS, ATPase and Fis domain
MTSYSHAAPTVPDDEEICPLETTEINCISRALKKFNGNYSQSAKALGISLSTLKRKVKSYNL